MSRHNFKTYKLECTECGKEFVVTECHIKRNKKFCSDKCRSMSRRNKHILIDGIPHKKCSKCGQTQPLTLFSKGKGWDGLSDRCKLCVYEYTQKNANAISIKNKERHPSKKPKHETICQYCDETYLPIKHGQKYCSHRCIHATWSKTPKGIISRKYEAHKRRVRMKNAGKLTPAIIKEVYDENILAYEELSCEYCGVNCEVDWHLEHRTPVSRGGTNEKDNLCISCPACNSSKFTKTEQEFQNIQIIEGIQQGVSTLTLLLLLTLITSRKNRKQMSLKFLL